MPLTLRQNHTLHAKNMRGHPRRHTSARPTLRIVPAPDAARLAKLNRCARAGQWANRVFIIAVIAGVCTAYAIVNDVPPEQKISSSEAARR